MKRSAGILLYRRRDAALEVLLGHPGGPFFARKDAGCWTLFKGELAEDEAPLEAARREFAEETGRALEDCAPGPALALGEIALRGGKRVLAWAVEGDWPEGLAVQSNTFEIEWPPRSGRAARFPEIDRAAWFGLEEARARISGAQGAFLERLAAAVDAAAPVFKLCPAADWGPGGLRPSADDLRDGFVHLSAVDQVEGTRARYFAEVPDLLCLEVDPRRLPPGALRWERSRGGARFPHLYGPLGPEAVAAVRRVEVP